MSKKWIKPGLLLLIVLLLAIVLPSQPLDPWNLFSLKKIATVIFALTLIQALGSLLIQFLGSRIGAILTGFLGGLISSTATTAALARKSKVASQKSIPFETLTFLSATTAMLFEGAILLLFSTRNIHYSLLLIFIGPILATNIMIFLLSKKQKTQHLQFESAQFEILPILKLSIFIIGILTLSKIFQNLAGQNGLIFLTFLVSLFEIHGSIIANVQLHDAGAFDAKLLGTLLTMSIGASYVSKLFLIYAIGGDGLKKQATKYTALLILSLAISWLAFSFTV